MTKAEAKTVAKLKLKYSKDILSLDDLEALLEAGAITQEMFDAIVGIQP